ncbi:MAG: hypothetical protein ACM3Q2_10240 [Syntrophothermus sp.]
MSDGGQHNTEMEKSWFGICYIRHKTEKKNQAWSGTMGQQQLLLIVLGIIIIGIAVVIGINYFHNYSVDAKRNNITNEGVNLAAQAQRYWRIPAAMGGGDKKFTGWKIPAQLENTPNGIFSADVTDDQIVIKAIGTELVTGNVPVEVHITVKPDTYKIDIIH